MSWWHLMVFWGLIILLILCVARIFVNYDNHDNILSDASLVLDKASVQAWYSPVYGYLIVKTRDGGIVLSEEQVLKRSFHEIGHHSWYRSDDNFKKNYCVNNTRFVLGYERDDWCEENFANQYADKMIGLIN